MIGFQRIVQASLKSSRGSLENTLAESPYPRLQRKFDFTWPDEALPLAQRAVALDPLSADSWEIRAESEFYSGRLDEAAAHGKKALNLSPDAWPGSILQSRIYLVQGRPQQALAEIALIRYELARAYLYPIAYYALGRKAESDAAFQQLIANHHQDAPYGRASVYAFRSQPDEDFQWLDRAYTQRNSGLIQTKADPFLKNMHNDPRFAAFLKKLNFPD